MLLLLLLLILVLLFLSLHVLLFAKCRYASVCGGKPNISTFRCENRKAALSFHSSQVFLSSHVSNQSQINTRTSF